MVNPVVSDVARSVPCLLVVDDDLHNRYAIAQQLRTEGFLVYEASNASEAMRWLAASVAFDAVVTDVQMPGEMDGVELADFIHARSPKTLIAVISGMDISARVAGKDVMFFRKPQSLVALVNAVREKIQQVAT